jgi:hypothetical protein
LSIITLFSLFQYLNFTETLDLYMQDYSKECMERKLKIWVVLMMAIAGMYAFDTYYDAGGVTGLVVNTASGADCRDSDNHDPYAAGITTSSIYPNGYAEDACVGNDLLEFYCSGSGPDAVGVRCPKGCFAGACN